MKFRIILSLFFAVIIAEKLNFCTENSKKLLNYRVIGGRSANVSALPFYTLLFSSNVNGYTEMCGGSILNERWILTAAHCLPEDLTKANARIGLSSINEFRQSVSIMKTVIHRGFSLDTASKDIALLKTRTPIALGNGVNAVCLTRDDSSITRPGTTGAVAGFGKSLEKISMGIQFNNGPSNVLKSTFLPIQDTKTCSLEWWKASGGQTRISTQNICAGSLGHGSAPGDSGGPLLVKDEFDNIVQVGITSFGANGLEGVLDQEHYPGVYTRVSSYIPWILKVIDDDANNSRSSTLFLALLLSVFRLME